MREDAPFFADVASAPEGMRAHWLLTEDGIRIRVAVWAGGTQGTAFIFPGRTEYVEKYGQVACRLMERNLSVVVIDWRGQGLSDRQGRTQAHGHVGDFREFQRDAAAALAAANDLSLPGPRYLFAHSMGGCIALRTLMEGHEFEAAILSAPMWRLQLRTALREAGAKALGLARVFGIDRRVSPVSTTEPDRASGVYTDNPLTSDAESFAWAQRQVARHPELALGPPSASWSRAALLEMLRLDFRPRPAIPMLVMVGGAEQIVSRTRIRANARRLPGARLLEFADARHELFLERPVIRKRIWENVDALIADTEPGQRRNHS